MSITRRDILKTSAVGMLAARRSGAGKPAKTVLESFNYSGVRLLDGPLRNQCLAASALFKGISMDSLLFGFRKRAGLPSPGTPLAGWYGGDVFNAFGQYVSGMARLSKGLEDAAAGEKAKELVAEWAKTIEPDGYFYYSRRPITPHYIYDKMMCGLVDLYEYGGFEQAVPLMERSTAWASKNLDRGRKRALESGATYDGNGEWYTLGENLYRAFQLTGNEAFKSFGDVWQYPAYWDMFTRPEPPDPFGFHAYSHVNTLSSAAMAYAVSGDPHYLQVITNAFDWLRRTQMYATGGFGPDEKLVRPDGALGKALESTYNSFETPCGCWAGFKLARYLLAFTGDARYGDWIERLLYNGIGAALPFEPDGSNFYYSEYSLKGGRKQYHPVKWACCSGTYPQAVADYHNLIYFRDAESVYVNLFVPSEVIWSRGDNNVKLTQNTAYPESDTTVLTVDRKRAGAFSLKFRVPEWSLGVSADVNGIPADIDARPGAWAQVHREWRAGDRLKIRIPMQLSWMPIDRQHPNRAAVTVGPVVLVRQELPVIGAAKGDLSHWLKRETGNLEFQADAPRRSRFVPFYKLGHGDVYQMYLDREEPSSL